MLHHNVPGAPFGGVGDSGQGSYHGKYGFKAFTHERTILELPTWLEFLLASRYPPYTAAATKQAMFRPKVAFKRGESLEDQRVASAGASLWWKGAVGLAVGAVAFGIVRNGQVQGMAKAFLM
jgi:aldehyde dehydrogenase (NAD+)